MISCGSLYLNRESRAPKFSTLSGECGLKLLLRGSAPWQRLVQSGFCEVALTLVFRVQSCHATSQNPQDSTIPKSPESVQALGMRAGIVVNVSREDRRRLEAIVSDRSAPQKHVWHRRDQRRSENLRPDDTPKPHPRCCQTRERKVRVDPLGQPFAPVQGSANRGFAFVKFGVIQWNEDDCTLLP
jgi:hypothetical protein